MKWKIYLIVCAASIALQANAAEGPASSSSPTDLVKALERAKAVPSGSQVAVAIRESEALVTIYSAKYAGAEESSLKIDAVLVAKWMFDQIKNVTRVKVRLGAPASSGTRVRQITVSKGDVRAFGAKEISQRELLSSLEVSLIKEVQPVTQMRTVSASSTTGAAANLEPMENFSASVRTTQPFVTYRNSESGMSLLYPRGWKVTERPDKDTLFKIEGAGAELSAGVAEGAGITKETVARLWEELILSQLAKYRLVKEQVGRIGPARSIQCLSKLVQFQLGDVPVSQRWFFFGQQGRIYHVAFSAASKQFEQVAPLMQNMMASITFTSPGVVRQTQRPSEVTAQLNYYRSSKGDVAFAYPKGWEVLEHPDPDTLVKITGKNNDGLGAEVAVGRLQIDPNASVSDVIKLVEEKYLESQKNYRKIKEQPIVFGPSSLSGTLQESVFEAHGITVKQMCVYHRSRDQLYTFHMIAGGWKDSEAIAFFHKLLGTFSVKD